MMKVLIDQKVEAIADRCMDLAIVALAVIAVVGLFLVDDPVALQVNETGFTSRVPAIVAAVVYPGCGLLLRVVRRSPAPWVRWLVRTIAFLLVPFELLAFANAA